MTSYDPGQTPYTPSTTPGYVSVPADAQPAADGDRWGIAALTVVITTLISCVPLVNCLAPLVPLVVGIVTLTKAKNAVDPSKARLYGWLATGLGGLFILAVLAIVVIYGSLIVSLMNDPQFRELQNLPRP